MGQVMYSTSITDFEEHIKLPEVNAIHLLHPVLSDFPMYPMSAISAISPQAYITRQFLFQHICLAKTDPPISR